MSETNGGWVAPASGGEHGGQPPQAWPQPQSHRSQWPAAQNPTWPPAPGSWQAEGARRAAEAARAEQRRRAARSAERMIGLDLARFLALAGMMLTHVWSFDLETGAGLWGSDLVSGKAAALFAVLAGVGIVLTTRRQLEAGRTASARLAVFGRGFALVMIGLFLGLLPGFIYVIIVYYGVTFWLTIPLLRWRSWALLVAAGVWAVAWPIASQLIRTAAELDQVPEVGSVSWADLGDPVAFGRGLMLTGVYPALSWVVYLLVGMAIGRGILNARMRGTLARFALVTAGVGIATAIAADRISALLLGPLGGFDQIVASLTSTIEETAATALVTETFADGGYGTSPIGTLWWLAGRAPHTGTPFDLLVTASIAASVIGLCLALGLVLRKPATTILSPVIGAGAAPLTVYAGHVFFAAICIPIAYALPDGYWLLSSPQTWIANLVGALAIGALISIAQRRGPLETFVHASGLALTAAAPKSELNRVPAPSGERSS